MKMLVLPLVGLAIVGSLFVEQAAPSQAALGPSKTEMRHYSARHDKSHQVEVTWRPEASNRPWVLAIHGGAWVSGDLTDVRDQAKTLNDAGYVVFNINYPLADPPTVTYDDTLTATKQALDWVRSNAKTFGIDPDNGALYGFSAGGNLALQLGLETNGTKGIKAIISVSGVVQPARVAEDALGRRPVAEPSTPENVGLYATESRLAGCEFTDQSESCKKAWKSLSPEYKITQGDPAVLLFGGTDDPIVHHNGNVALVDMMRQKGIDAAAVPVLDAGHNPLIAFDSGVNQQRLLEFLASKLRQR